MKPIPTQDQVRELFFYDAQTGHLIRKKCSYNPKCENEHLIGKVCSCLSHGYLVVSIRKKLYPVHRIIWLYVKGTWPKHDIDHINGNRSDNRIENLRHATREQNQQKRTVRNRNNTSGHPGVYWDTSKNKWCVEIKVRRKKICLGNYSSKEEAIRARIEGKIKHHTFEPIDRSVKIA